VSAVIITYNRARYLRDAIESARGQTFGDVELIVVDDGSTDETPAVVAQYGDAIRYVRRRHEGKAAARNIAVQVAQGELIAFCDSDDCWYPDRLERQLQALERAPRVGMIHGQVDIVDSAQRLLPDETAAHCEIFRAAHRRGATYAGYASECRCLSSTVLIKRAVFEKVGLYDRELAIEDYDFYLRLLLDFEVMFMDEPPLAKHRVHAEMTSEEDLGVGQIQTAEKHLKLLHERPDIAHARAARRNFNVMIARSWRVLGDRRRARAAALRAAALGAPQALRLAL
jgi:glycosyltransferase involved in cell wall biosynthesis